MIEKLEHEFVGIGFIVSDQNKKKEERKVNLQLSYRLGSEAVQANVGILLAQASFQGWP